MYRIRFLCWSVNQKNFLLQYRFWKWNRHSYILEKLLLQKDKKMISFWENINHLTDWRWNPCLEESIRRILFCEIHLSKGKQDVDTLQRFILQKDQKMISFCENIDLSKILLFIYRIKSFWRDVSPKNFLLRNMPFKIEDNMSLHQKSSFWRKTRKWFLSVEIWIRILL